MSRLRVLLILLALVSGCTSERPQFGGPGSAGGAAPMGGSPLGSGGSGSGATGGQTNSGATGGQTSTGGAIGTGGDAGASLGGTSGTGGGTNTGGSGGAPPIECSGKGSVDLVCIGVNVVRCGTAGSAPTMVQACEGNTPLCVAGACVGRSCDGLPSNCGPSGNESCCTSLLVPGATFNRNNDPATPATVSDYLLDKYEITAGRFRKFRAGYDAWRSAGHPLPAEGVHDLIPGTGWVQGWALPANQTALDIAIHCDGNLVWTDAPGDNETRPMNCLDWFTASAFCAWDGGRLPTEAEWENAATGGGEQQRVYPWGSTVPGNNGALCAHHCYYDGVAMCSPADIPPVGSIPAGNGKYGHADLAGSMQESIFDWTSNYITPCIDCAETTNATARGSRGGAWAPGATDALLARQRINGPPLTRHSALGARCARKTPR